MTIFTTSSSKSSVLTMFSIHMKTQSGRFQIPLAGERVLVGGLKRKRIKSVIMQSLHERRLAHQLKIWPCYIKTPKLNQQFFWLSLAENNGKVIRCEFYLSGLKLESKILFLQPSCNDWNVRAFWVKVPHFLKDGVSLLLHLFPKLLRRLQYGRGHHVAIFPWCFLQLLPEN